MKQVTSPLKKIKVNPLAAESFGVRSMCTLVETPDLGVLLDGGISLAPYRFSLPPHPFEFQTIARLRKNIEKAADKATVTTISHYHFDHHTPSFEDWVVNWTEEGETARQIYQNKTVLVKNPKANINSSQRQRGWIFQKANSKHAKVVESADGKIFSFGKTTIRFSEAVPHGSENSLLGWVIMAFVEYEEERFVFAPDIQGPMSNRTLILILNSKPTAIMLGGPPFYLGGFRVDLSQLEQGSKNLEKIAGAVPLVILEHHALRDEFWKQKIETVYKKASQSGHSIMTAAEFVGKENLFLESRRKQLYHEQPPSNEFRQWITTLKNKKIAKPPV
jgi:predicted metallo-beta-lactamase superfamily hydrolase